MKMVYRVSQSTYIAAGIVTAVPLAVCFLAALRQPQFWLPFVGVGFLLVALFIWLRAFELSISDAELSYRSLFGGRISLSNASIESAWLEVGVVGPGDRFRSPTRIVVQAKSNAVMRINTKVFSAKALGDLHAFLERNGKLRQFDGG